MSLGGKRGRLIFWRGGDGGGGGGVGGIGGDVRSRGRAR